MKKYYLLFLLLFIPINIFGLTDCNGKIDYENYNKELINTLDYKSEELINEGLVMEERKINVRKDDEALTVIEFKNITLKDKKAGDILLIELYYEGNIIYFDTNKYENTTSVFLGDRSHFYLYEGAHFTLENHSENFSYDNFKISINLEGSEIESFDLILKNHITDTPVYIEHFKNPDLNNISFTENKKLVNTKEKTVYDYYKYTYNCVEDKPEEIKNTIFNISREDKLKSKTKKYKSNEVINNNLSKEKSKKQKKSFKLNKNNKNGILTSLKNKNTKHYLKKHNNYLFYYYLSLPFLIILFIIFITKFIKTRPKNITSFVETLEV